MFESMGPSLVYTLALSYSSSAAQTAFLIRQTRYTTAYHTTDPYIPTTTLRFTVSATGRLQAVTMQKQRFTPASRYKQIRCAAHERPRRAHTTQCRTTLDAWPPPVAVARLTPRRTARDWKYESEKLESEKIFRHNSSVWDVTVNACCYTRSTTAINECNIWYGNKSLRCRLPTRPCSQSDSVIHAHFLASF